MALYVADANFLLRLVERAHPHHPIARTALGTLHQRRDEIVIVAQSLFEFYVVATRPGTARGGLGFTPTEAARQLKAFERLFRFLPEQPLYPTWARLVSTYGTQGLPAHDARYIAAIEGQGVDHILTFNGKDFARYAPEGITPIDPANV